MRWDGDDWIWDRAFKHLDSDQSRVSTVTPTDIAGLSVDLCKGLWILDARLGVASASLASDIVTAWRIAGTATVLSRYLLAPALPSDNTSNTSMRATGSYVATIQSSGAGGGQGRLQDEILLNVTASSTLHLQAAQAASNATAVLVKAGSFIEARRVG